MDSKGDGTPNVPSSPASLDEESPVRIFVLQDYYDYVPVPSHKVSSIWKVGQIVLFVLAGVTGAVGGALFGRSMHFFGDNCILDAELVFKMDNGTRESIIDDTLTEWGDASACYMAEYVPIFAMLLGTILTSFFLMCPRGGAGHVFKELADPWRLVYPALVLTAIFLFIDFQSLTVFRHGFTTFCKNLLKSTITPEPSCGTEMNARAQLPLDGVNVYAVLLSGYVLCIVSICAWCLALLMLSLRIVFSVDFSLIHVVVSSQGKPSDEEVEKIEKELRHTFYVPPDLQNRK